MIPHSIFNKRASIIPYFTALALSAMTSVTPSNAQTSSIPDAAISEAITLFNNARYTELLSAAENMVSKWPTDYEGYYFLTSAHLRMGDMNGAESAYAKGTPHAQGNPELTKQHQSLRESIDRYKTAHRDINEGNEALKKSQTYLAAEKFTAAYKLLSHRYEIGQQAAKIWLHLGETAQAAKIYAGFLSNPAAPKAEAQSFFNANKNIIETLFRTNVQQGWEKLGGDTVNESKSHFQDAVALKPDYAEQNAYVEGLSNPYIGLAAASAALNDRDGIVEALRKGRAIGLKITQDLPENGNALGIAMCGAGLQQELHNMYGPNGTRWAQRNCILQTQAADWREVEGLQLQAKIGNLADMYSEAAGAYQKIVQILNKPHWAGSSKEAEAQDLKTETECKIRYMQALELVTQTNPNFGAVDNAVRYATECTNKDYTASDLEAKVRETKLNYMQRNTYTVKVCNRSSEDSISVAFIHRPISNPESWKLSAWYTVKKDACVDLKGSYGQYQQTNFYLHGDSKNFTWWKPENADATFCVSSRRTERTLESNYTCARDETSRGFKKMTVSHSKKGNDTSFTFR